MPTTLRLSAGNSSTTGTDATVDTTGHQVGDKLVFEVHFNGQTTIADNNAPTPTTVTAVSDYKPNTSSGHTVAIFTRTVQTGDPTTWHFTGGASGRWSVTAQVWQNPNADFFDVAPSTANAANADNSSAATINAPSITTLTNNAIHVVVGFFDDGAAGIPSGPAGYTTAGTENDEPQGVFYKVITSAGATGAQTVTGATSSPRIALSYAIKDVGASAVVKDIIGVGVIPFAR